MQTVIHMDALNMAALLPRSGHAVLIDSSLNIGQPITAQAALTKSETMRQFGRSLITECNKHHD